MTDAAYAASTDPRALADWLRSRHDVVVLTHEKPDGDAMGSTLAVARALQRLPGPPGSRRVECWYWAPWPNWAKELAGSTPARFFDREPAPEQREPDGVLIMDTGSFIQVEHAAAWLRARPQAVAIVDHHRQGDASMSPRRVIDTRWAATAQPAAELCRLLLDLPSCAALPREIADPLYLGLATDTGWFRHSNLTGDVMRLAAELLEAGADNVGLYQRVEQQDRPERVRLMARVLASLQLHDRGRVAVMTVTKKDMADSGALGSDTGGLIDIPAAIASVRVSVLLTEADHAATPAARPGPLTKISLRAKGGPGSIDVSRIAMELGGGGHVGAAGAKLPLPVDQAAARVVDMVSRALASQA